MNKILTFLVVVFLAQSLTFSQEWINNLPKNSRGNYFEVQKSFNDYWSDKPYVKGHGYKQFKRLEYFFQDRILEDGTTPDFFKVTNEYEKYISNYKQKNPTIQADANWSFIGPTVRPTGTGIGRVNCIYIDPNNDNILYAGAAFGGLWKTTNAGSNWTPLLNTQFQSIGVSSVGISKSNSNIVYAVTGDADAAGIFGSTWCYSVGLIKSIDGGNTWTATGLISTLNAQKVIYKVIVNPNNANLIYVAEENGFKKSTDGGTTWTTISSSPCRDIIYHPTNPQIVYGAFLNTNNYYEFRVYNESTQSLTVKDGVIGSSRVALAVSKAEPNSAWAVAVSYNMGFNSIYKTTDGGGKWNKLCDASNTANICSFYTSGTGTGGQGLYDLCIAVSNTNANEVYVGAINMWKSTNSGKNWICATDWTGSTLPYLHADQHSFCYNSTGILYCGNDGGVTRTSNGGSAWINISDGLGISQFYKISTAKLNSNTIIGGTQDNGTMLRNGSTWNYVQAGDGMQATIDQTDANIIYASFYGNDGVINFTRSTNGGQDFTVIINKSITNEQSAWVAPIAINPNNSNIIFVGYQNVWKSTNRGSSWTKVSNISGVLRSIVISKSNVNYMYATNGTNVYQSTNGGTNWNSIYTSSSPGITNLAIDHTNPQRIWVTHSGYVANRKVTLIEDGTVVNITGTLPNVPVNCVTVQENDTKRLYIGTDVGVFTRDDNSSDWAPFNTNLPNIVVLDLNIHNGSGLLRAATYARGIWETKVNDCNLATPQIQITGDTTFCAGDSVTLENSSNFSSYLWSNGAKTKKIIVKSSGKFSCTVTDANNCTATSREINVTSNSIPSISISSGSNILCEGDSVALTASLGFGTYKWSNGDTGRKIYVKNGGKFIVIGTTTSGCTNNAEITITMNPKPAKPTITKNGDLLVSSTASSYQWYLDGNAISGATSINYQVAKSGKYKVEITDSKGCKNISDELSITYQTVELETDNQFIRISPNPNSGEFIITFKENSILSNIEILNQFGEKVNAQINDQSSLIEVNLKNYSNGIYYLRFLNNNKIYVVKIIKNN